MRADSCSYLPLTKSLYPSPNPVRKIGYWFLLSFGITQSNLLVRDVWYYLAQTSLRGIQVLGGVLAAVNIGTLSETGVVIFQRVIIADVLKLE